MNDLNVGEQPRCPECGTVMQDYPKGFRCVECGSFEDHSSEYDKIEMAPDFEGPSIHGGQLEHVAWGDA